MNSTRRGALASLVALAAAQVALAAPLVAQQPFYEGKQINLIVGSGVGGGYDVYSRLVARHWAKHIPGKPNIVVQNLPAAGSLVATNNTANTYPRDGLTVAQVQTHMAVEPLMGVTGSLDNVKFDSRTLNWIGSIAKEFPVVVAWHTAPIKSFKEILSREMVVGASGTATSDAVYPRLMNELIGTRFKVIDGYKDNPQMILATETGEIMGRAGWFVSSLLSTQGQPLKEGRLKVLAQVATEKHPLFPDVPLVTEYMSDAEKRRKLEFSISWLPMGRPFVAPPGVPADRVKILRDSFMATARDPDLLAEAQKMNLEISPLSGEDTQALVEKLYQTPKDVIQAVRAIMVPARK
jgi:tripartite-type tricarboxylate transporter receptor subunit TctC